MAYFGAVDVDAVEQIAARIRSAVEEGVVEEDPSIPDVHALTAGEHWFLTPGDELVHVSTQAAVRDPVTASHMRVVFPEREAPEGYPVYGYEQSADQVLSRMESDGGWTEVDWYEWTDSPQCPECARFMRRSENHDGWPEAECNCGTVADIDDLIRQGAVAEVY